MPGPLAVIHLLQEFTDLGRGVRSSYDLNTAFPGTSSFLSVLIFFFEIVHAGGACQYWIAIRRLMLIRIQLVQLSGFVVFVVGTAGSITGTALI